LIAMGTAAQQDQPGRDSHNTKSNADPVIVAEWSLNKREALRVSVELYNGVWLINFRKWFQAGDGKVRPGKHGIALGVKHLPRLSEAATKALTIALERDLIPAEEMNNPQSVRPLQVA
jgi:hypothetical protein